ncbi:peroxiredoxin [Caldicellulosiruptor bescii]|uniref:Alkyl hydroperoxide reductase/ Thiol specific antioxidant/ Mal allergen n=2 Tax=Caldicellulosiruptor bescii TaxID=31899 RepID=B9MKX8_CALBD|nr:TlpA family protein disulfide reductase [Caldicellulosiruptor bescii]ACM60986.1 alkyl hydroperoxide reductase/ Thiol specific antioxidant/ Mal allergen [Caldicellulosiruptor bescii DSM 6725]PBC89201.1 peroxiredoxin [Caldicellulosiruptor bescii]PBC91317.1 peroxiredoxin [Caldicellulosiruptor bescii]PBD03271.1 peroxiredoxin [Caldicellulosiruptor bescii]PBD07115.1 peroxiredoxin [Caldicellulosiruptor bescii]
MLNNKIKNVIFILISAILIGLLVYQIMSRSKENAAAEGIVNFKLVSVDGKEYSLSDFRGKKVVLNFFATWCPPCRAEIPDFERFYRENEDVVLIGINIQEDKTTVEEFLSSMGVTYPVLLDRDGKISAQFGIEGIPTTFLIDEKGKVIAKNVGMMTYDQLKKFAGK